MATAATFGAASFYVRINNVARNTEAEVSTTHIPGSSVNVVEIGGLLTEALSYELYFATDTDYDTLWNLVGTSGTLTTYDFSGTAYLKSLRRNWVNPVGDYATTATAEWIA